MAQQIPLTQGLFATVDDADYEYLMKYKWHAQFNQTSRTFRANRMVKSKNGKRRSKSMAEEIMGARDGYLIDHKNRNTLDHTRDNLRYATFQQNCQNRITKNRTGLPHGVSAVGAKFSTKIVVGGGRLFLGTFDTKEEAAIAYQAASRKYFGEFSPYAVANN